MGIWDNYKWECDLLAGLDFCSNGATSYWFEEDRDVGVDELDEYAARLEAKIKGILEALNGHGVDMLLAKAKQLKQTDGEGWAIGELVERAVRIRG